MAEEQKKIDSRKLGLCEALHSPMHIRGAPGVDQSSES